MAVPHYRHLFHIGVQSLGLQNAQGAPAHKGTSGQRDIQQNQRAEEEHEWAVRL